MRVVVPADVRSMFGKTELLESLGTGDDSEAVRLGTPIIAKFKRQIADARGQVSAPPPPDDRLTVGLVQSRFDAWERRAIRNAEAAYINDVIAPPSWSDKATRSDFLYALAQPDAAVKVQGFTDRMAEALAVPTNHPALDHRQFQFWFRQAWQRVERAVDRFAAGDFSDIEDGDEEADEGAHEVALAAVMPAKGKRGGNAALFQPFVFSASFVLPKLRRVKLVGIRVIRHHIFCRNRYSVRCDAHCFVFISNCLPVCVSH